MYSRKAGIVVVLVWCCLYYVSYDIAMRMVDNGLDFELTKPTPYIVEKLVLVSIITVQSIMCAKWDYHGLKILIVCTLYYSISLFADLSEDIGHIKCFSCSVMGVSKIKSINSITFYAIYGVVHFQLTDISCEDCENMLMGLCKKN